MAGIDIESSQETECVFSDIIILELLHLYDTQGAERKHIRLIHQVGILRADEQGQKSGGFHCKQERDIEIACRTGKPVRAAKDRAVGLEPFL